MRNYLKNLTWKERSDRSDRHLAYALTFVAGAANAGGFMAIKQYTSHMSGIVSAMADNFILGKTELFISGLGGFLAFVTGAACSAILVNWGKRLHLHGQYALPLMMEAFLLMIFGLYGSRIHLDFWFYEPITVILLCFIMGLQNATITKLSQSRIRTTHITGLVTDFGIELGKLAYINLPSKNPSLPPVKADQMKLALLFNLISLFFVGGISGAYSFSNFGFNAASALALIVATLAIVPIIEDIKHLAFKNFSWPK
jgi:uncharacterized membrane protein YoaK (UPF0700 family)